MIAPREQGARLGAEQQVLRGARPGAPVDPVPDEVGSGLRAGAGGLAQMHGVARDRIVMILSYCLSVKNRI